MERIPIPFVGSTNQARSSIDNAQLSENMYLEFDEAGKNAVKLYRTPGLKWKMSAGVGPNRSNIVVFKGNGYFVSRNELIKIDRNFDKTTIGTLDTSSGWVSIVAGRDYVTLVDGTKGYTTQGTSLTEISDADFPNGAKHITVINGRYIVDGTSQDTFWMSDDEDPTSWNALNFASADKKPDDLVLPYATEDILWMIGENSSEPWYYNGNVDFPFAPIQGAVSNWGIQAPNSIAEGDKTLFWLAKSEYGQNTVVMSRGTQLQEISPSWLVYQISQLSADDAEGIYYQQAGHSFYVLTFPKALKTWVFDLKTGEWHSRSTWSKGRWRARGYGFYQGLHLVGDYNSSDYYEMDLSTYQDNTGVMKCLRRAPVIHKSHREMTFFNLIVDIEGGQGLLTGQGSDPKAMLRYSDDGGKSWSDILETSLGKIGEYKYKAWWSQLGMSYERIFEIAITDPIDFTVLGAYAEIELGAH